MSDERRSMTRRQFLERSTVSALAGVALAPAVGQAGGEARRSAWARLASDPADSEGYWKLVKREFLIEPGVSYMNTGTYGPSPRSLFEKATHDWYDLDRSYNQYFRTHLLGQPVHDLVNKVAAFVGANPDDIAFTSGTTEAMNYIANGLDLNAGDEVITTTHEHEAGIYPWLLIAKRRGIRVRQLPVTSPPRDHQEILNRFHHAITPRTRVFSFCHIQYTDGCVLPVKELCRMARERGILSVVDGAQAVGMLDFRLSDLGCDFYATSLHKWLATPYGTGLLYVSQEMQDRFWPTVVLDYSGWDSVDRYGGKTEKTYKVTWPKALAKYSTNLQYYGPLFWAVPLGIKFQELIGRARIEARIRLLADHLKRGLLEIPGVTLYTSMDPSLSAGLTSFRLSGVSTERLFRQLIAERGIIIRYVQQEGIGFDVNRVSTHIFNTMEEIEALLAALRGKVAKAE